MPKSETYSDASESLSFFRMVIHPVLVIASIVVLLALIGWTGAVTHVLHWTTAGIGIAFGLERFWVFARTKARGRERVRLGFHTVLAAVVFIVAVVVSFQKISGKTEWSVGEHLFIQVAVIISGLLSMIHHQSRFTARAFHPGWMLIGSFFLIIVAGALLLKMPLCVVAGQHCSWLDAFFTSTSAVCVTGLAVQNTAHFFSHTGQVVILLLIQVGGLGIMTLSFFAAVVLFEGLSLHDRLLLGRMIQDNRLARIGQTLSFIVGMTFVIEGIGALILFFGSDGLPTLRGRIYHSIFHSISAFCNAGFSTFPDGLASPVMDGNALWQVVIMALIAVGGLGAFVVEDLVDWSRAKLFHFRTRSGKIPRLKVHTRLVLVTTAILIVGGALAIGITEFVLAKGPINGGVVLTSFFHSVTARTAGFNTVTMSKISMLTAQVLVVLMFIGGSPGGTAGGIRTTVAAVGLGHLWCQLRDAKSGMVIFNRSIAKETGAQALGLLVLGVLWLGPNLMILEWLESGRGYSDTQLLFELVSAFATVGLSLDLTPGLTDGSKILLIVNMFVGRVGLLTVLATLIPPNQRPSSGKPVENITLT